MSTASGGKLNVYINDKIVYEKDKMSLLPQIKVIMDSIKKAAEKL